MVDLISASQREMGQWSLDYLRTHHISSSWQIDGADIADMDNSTMTEVNMVFALFSNYQVSFNVLVKVCKLIFPIFILKIPQNTSSVEQRNSAKSDDDARVGSVGTKNKGTLGKYYFVVSILLKFLSYPA